MSVLASRYKIGFTIIEQPFHASVLSSH
ncbi:hypothetical protein O9993_01275 [Vibrio lentus]|nr:hypothetical protein [Vibrio lentus]